MRADGRAVVDALDEPGQIGIVIPEVADGRDSACDVLHRGPVCHVCVHVEEPGQQHAAARVDFRFGGLRGRSGLVQRCDATGADIHVLRRAKHCVFGIEHASVADHDRLGQPVRELHGEVFQESLVSLRLTAFQLIGYGFPTDFDDPCPPGSERSEECHLGPAGCPAIRGLGVEALEDVERHVARLAPRLDALVEHFLDLELAARECLQTTSGL